MQEVSETQETLKDKEFSFQINKEALDLLENSGITIDLGSQGAINDIELVPKYGFKFIPDRYQRWIGKVKSILFLLKGDVVLNLETGETTTVQEHKESLLFRNSQRRIVVRSGVVEEPPTIRYKEERRSLSPAGTFTSNFNSHYLPLSQTLYEIDLNQKIEQIKKEDGVLEETTLGDYLERQALTALKTKDGQVVLPSIQPAQEVIIHRPERLAKFIFENNLIEDEKAGELNIDGIFWLISRKSIEDIVVELDYRELGLDPREEKPATHIRERVLEKLARNLEKIGMKLAGSEDIKFHFSSRETALENIRTNAEGTQKLISSLAQKQEVDEIRESVAEEHQGHLIEQARKNILLRELEMAAQPGHILGSSWVDTLIEAYSPKVNEYWDTLEKKVEEIEPQRQLLEIRP